jgi:hypothetical protein
MAYATEDLSAKGRLEYRTEDGILSGSDLDNDTVLATLDLSYKIDETQRIIFSADSLRSRSNEASFRDGDYIDVSLGYALRPIENDRFNMLARYRYLDDDIGQELDGTDDTGQVQRSHVASVDASYDLDRHWTINGKFGYRSAQTAADRTSEYAQNDAWLGVLGARYHLVNDWDLLAEARHLSLITADFTETSALIAAFKQINGNLQIGAGYNFSSFSDDLTDLTYDDQGVFLNIVAQY